MLWQEWELETLETRNSLSANLAKVFCRPQKECMREVSGTFFVLVKKLACSS